MAGKNQQLAPSEPITSTGLDRCRGGIRFRSMQPEDLPMLELWLQVPRNEKWWASETVMADLEDHLSDSRIRQWIVEIDDAAVAYVQDYDISGWEDHPLDFLPSGARGVDTFIAHSDLMGKGLAVRYLKAFCELLFAEGIPAVGIDPDPENAAALRCYSKVGFKEVIRRTTKWGDAVCMAIHQTRDDRKG